MAYQANIPTPSQRLKDSQPDLLANFQAIKTLIDVNHSTFSSGTEGKHKWVTFPLQAVSPATLASEIALYAKTSAYSGATELVFRRESNGTEIEFTTADLSSATVGWTILPSGLIMKWGTVTIAGAGAQQITFPVGAGIPVFTFALSAQITPFTATTTNVITLRGYHTTHLLVQTSVAGMQAVYLAFGR